MKTWKQIPGYGTEYMASDDGNIMRISAQRGTKPGYIFKPCLDSKGYLRTRLTNEDGAKTVKVHRIIAQTFIPNPNNYPQVNHKNGIKTDNRVVNLEWADNSMNIKHSYEKLNRTKTHKGKFGADHNRSIPITAKNIDTGEVREFIGINEAARQLETNSAAIWRVKTGEYKHTKRWIFS